LDWTREPRVPSIAEAGGGAGVITTTARPVAIEVIEATFTGRGPWKRRIPQILEALAALGRARVVNGSWTLG
jgi:hypothetical protein